MKQTAIGKFKTKLISFKKKFMGTSLILMYHRVTKLYIDPWQLSVSPRHFAEHLDVLQRTVRTLRLDHFATAFLGRKVPKRSVVITFDDGYADNLTTAKPLLERFCIPATFFISTACIEGQREFWWDELERLILHPLKLPDYLQINIHGKRHEWDLSDDTTRIEDRRLKHRSWRPWEEAPSIRHKIYYVLWQLLKPLANNERLHLLDQLQEWTGTPALIRSTHRLLRPEDIHLLAHGDLIEIGAHTATHASLPSHALNYQRKEIDESKRYLENLLNNCLTSFAYPYGDYTPETTALVRDAGFSCACSTHAGGVSWNTGRYQLPRLQVSDCDGEMFEKQLLTWLANQCL